MTLKLFNGICVLLFSSLFAQVESPYLFETSSKAFKITQENEGFALIVSKENFPVLEDITCYTVELWDESMRLPHWHPNASELGYVKSGKLEIILWRSPGETAVFTVGEGMCWFIPQGALHSLNNISSQKAEILVAFSSELPQNIDLPVAFNGIAAPLRDALTSPHDELKKWVGPSKNPLIGAYTPNLELKHLELASPYKFDLSTVTPLFSDPNIGSVVWGIKDNWNILENISMLRAHLKPRTARDLIWYPDVNTLYVVTKGEGVFYLHPEGKDVEIGNAKVGDYFFVPTGLMHTFVNNGDDDFETVAFFSKANPLPEVSLSVATAFFPDSLLRDAMNRWANSHLQGDPLRGLKWLC